MADPSQPRAPMSPWRVAVLVFLTGVVALHLFAVTFAAVPPNRVSEAVQPSSGYLQPYFTQNWRLFAPNPVAQDRSIRFQMAYRDESGDVRQSEWIDWTSVELDLVHHRLVGGRAGYVTNKMFESLGRTYRALSSQQRTIANGTPDDAPPSWAALQSDLLAAVETPERVASYLRYERATAGLATDVVLARYPEQQIVAVRYSVVTRGVTPYALRAGSAAEREEARPGPVERLSGWRSPTPGSDAERRAVAEFDARHR